MVPGPGAHTSGVPVDVVAVAPLAVHVAPAMATLGAPVEVVGPPGDALQATVDTPLAERRLLAYQDALRRYHPQPIDVAVQLFAAEQRRHGLPSTLGWESCVPAAALRVQTVPGDHYSMMLSPQIEVLAQALATALTAHPSERSKIAMEMELP